MGTPQVTPISESRHTGGFVVWDPSDGLLTRAAITLKSGIGIVTAGLVLAVLLTGTATAAPIGANTGTFTYSAITVSSAAVPGIYSLEFNDATHFVVTAPGGSEVGHGTTGVAYSAGGLAFTITAGGTAAVPGDSSAITVVATAVKYVAYDPTATDGSQIASAILWSGYRDATSADKKAVANVRGPMRINVSELVWGANVTTQAQQTAALASLAALGILNT